MGEKRKPEVEKEMAEQSENQEKHEETVMDAQAEAETQENAADKEPEVVEDSQDGVSAEEESKNEEHDFKQKFYYLAAEMDNMKKRFDREKEKPY
jgi:molecular chaperone GrpE